MPQSAAASFGGPRSPCARHPRRLAAALPAAGLRRCYSLGIAESKEASRFPVLMQSVWRYAYRAPLRFGACAHARPPPFFVCECAAGSRGPAASFGPAPPARASRARARRGAGSQARAPRPAPCRRLAPRRLRQRRRGRTRRPGPAGCALKRTASLCSVWRSWEQRAPLVPPRARGRVRATCSSSSMRACAPTSVPCERAIPRPGYCFGCPFMCEYMPYLIGLVRRGTRAGNSLGIMSDC